MPPDVMPQEANRGIQDGFFPEEKRHENHKASNPNYQITRNKGKKENEKKKKEIKERKEVVKKSEDQNQPNLRCRKFYQAVTHFFIHK